MLETSYIFYSLLCETEELIVKAFLTNNVVNLPLKGSQAAHTATNCVKTEMQQ